MFLHCITLFHVFHLTSECDIHITSVHKLVSIAKNFFCSLKNLQSTNIKNLGRPWTGQHAKARFAHFKNGQQNNFS